MARDNSGVGVTQHHERHKGALIGFVQTGEELCVTVHDKVPSFQNVGNGEDIFVATAGEVDDGTCSFSGSLRAIWRAWARAWEGLQRRDDAFGLASSWKASSASLSVTEGTQRGRWRPGGRAGADGGEVQPAETGVGLLDLALVVPASGRSACQRRPLLP